MGTVALYARISRDKSGQVEGVDRQERWGRKYADEHWPRQPVEVFTDNNLGGGPDNHRPGFEALRAAVRSGAVSHLWTVEQSRLTRDGGQWFELSAELLDHDIDEIHTRSGIVRLGEVGADIGAVVNAHERRELRKRTNRTLEDLAAEGRPHGGHHVAYRHVTQLVDGRAQAGLEVIPEIADHVRDAADLVLAGWSLSAVAREMQRRRVPTVYGRGWTNKAVKGALTSPMVAGYRTHKGQVLRRGNWEPVLDEQTWRTLCARLARTKRGHRKYLLSGLARCGRCGAGLTGRLRQAPNGRTKAFYYCAISTGGCGRLGIVAEVLDEHVVSTVLAEIDKPGFWSAVAADEHEADRRRLTQDLEDIEQRHAALARKWAAGEIPEGAWDAARVDLDTRRREVQDELAEIPQPLAIDPTLISGGWESMTLAERRTVLDILIASVVVSPATPGGQSVDRVSIEWRMVR
jgi:site-specific DNA recombinase